MPEPPAEFLEWAWLALQRYPLQSPHLSYIGHSDNLTFQVTDGATRQKYLLRLHEPVTETFLGPRHQSEAIASELAWLEALAVETDITVQRPVHSLDGELVPCLVVPGREENLPCSLLGWVEGDLLKPDDPEAPDQVRRLGDLMARMHHQAAGWRAPAGFLRPQFGPDHFHQVVDQLAPGVDMGIIQPADFEVIRQTGAAAAGLIGDLEPTPQAWGMIHNDLHAGNWLINDHAICPIDFSLCGFGYYLSDIATSAGSLPVALRAPYFAGYAARRPLPEGFERLVEAFFIASRLGYYAFLLPEPTQHSWLRRRIPQVIETICRPFLAEEGFLFGVR